MEKTRLFVLSVDAMVSDDLEYIKTLPNMSRIYDFGTRVERVRTIYPSLTYPCHVSMATGCLPNRHGVINNELPIPGSTVGEWFWYARYQKVRNIFDAAHEGGYSVSSVHWPVMAGSGSVDWLVPEIWTCGEKTDYLSLVSESGASDPMMEIIRKNLHYYGESTPPSHPEFDDYAMANAVDVIDRFAPEVMFCHDARIDGARHSFGILSDRVLRAYDELDVWLGRIFDAMKRRGVFEQTNIILTSDHGQMNFVRLSALNVLLARDGYITLDADGNIADYKAFVKSAGLSAHVMVKDRSDERLINELYKYFMNLQRENLYGIGGVMTRAAANERYGLDGDFELVLEFDGYTDFAEEWTGPVIRNLLHDDYHYYHATHGHMPEKGPQPCIMFSGPDIKPGVVIPDGVIIDEAPTYAALLGVELPQAQGKALDVLK